MPNVPTIGPTATEIVALTRLASDPEATPPSHLCTTLLAKGWITTDRTGSFMLTVAGRILANQSEEIDLDQLASIPANWAVWQDAATA